MDVAQTLAQRLFVTDNGTVQLIVLQFFINIRNTAYINENIDRRIDLAERGKNNRQPVGCDTGISAEAERGAVVLTETGRLLLQRIGRIQKSLHLGLQSLTGGGEADTVFAADQEIETELLLQRVHHVREARLRISELRCRGGQASLFHRQQQGVYFLAVHGIAFLADETIHEILLWYI